jgi:enolase
MKIKKIIPKKIKNSRGEETIKITIKSTEGKGIASAPSGASKGKHEVKDITNLNDTIKFLKNNKEIKNLEINNFEDLKQVEKIVNKEKNGSNPVIALEYAILKSMNPIWKTINNKTRKIPRPLGNVIGGGKHFKYNSPDIQEFLVYSIGARSVEDAIKANTLVHNLTKIELKKIKNFNYETTDEGAWAPNLSNIEVLDLLTKVIKKISNEVGFKIKLGIDVAASSFWDGKHYNYKNFSKEEKNKKLNKKEQIEFISKLIEDYSLHYVEDPLHEEDFSGFAELNKKYKKSCMVVGDDLTVTDTKRLKKAIKNKSINSVIIKPNQIGSLIETKEFIEEAKKNKLYLIISHRSGETMDTSISHLAVGFEIPVIKCGIYGKERIVKLDELRKIQKQIRLKI